MALMLDADQLVDEFADADRRMPFLFFGLLRLYRERGPFPFDAEQIAKALAGLAPQERFNPVEIAELQPQIERLFEATRTGLAPRARFVRDTVALAP